MSLEHSPTREGTPLGHKHEPFVSERDASKFLNVSVRTLQRWRTEPPPNGAPRFFKLGAKRVAYRLSDLTEWAEAQSFNSTSEMDARVGISEAANREVDSTRVSTNTHRKKCSEK
tara:strand:+ start:1770 stop:2114 length:345 start_codon:yes stop_codon:yes gene_type:complete